MHLPVAITATKLYPVNRRSSGLIARSKINFYWGNDSPDRSLPPLNFSARWQGNFNFDQGNYMFTVITSDGMRLYIDGNLIIDQWRDQPPYIYKASLLS